MPNISDKLALLYSYFGQYVTLANRLATIGVRFVGDMSLALVATPIGVSYPTVAAVIKDLEASGVLGRGFNRSVELKRFPWSEWRNWLSRASTGRRTVLYRSSMKVPGLAQAMLKRLGRLGRDDLAVGGTIGAAKHFSRLDVVGTPRLDLLVLGERDDFTQHDAARLDPSLESYTGDPANADLAVHFIGRRRTPRFLSEGNKLYADELNCLADLYELGLDAQGGEMLRNLVDARSTAT